MKKFILFFFLTVVSGTSMGFDCRLVYDEFDNIMNKEFLLNPEKFVTVKNKRLSRQEYNTRQKNLFLLSSQHKNMGIAVVHTNKNTWGKILFTWGKPVKKGQPSLIIKEAVLYGRVQDGYPPRVLKNITLKSSFTLDLDSGKSGGKKADIWFHNVDGKEMYIEAVNGASLKFPMRSLCDSTVNTTIKPHIFKAIEPAAIHNLKPVLKPPVIMQNTTQGSSQGDTRYIVKREILVNGHVLFNYSDGSKKELFKGGYKNIEPDGRESQVMFKTAAPVAIPVAPPGVDENAWLESHRSKLLYVIRSLVADSDLVEQYLANVDNSNDLYESIVTRTTTIQQLVSH